MTTKATGLPPGRPRKLNPEKERALVHRYFKLRHKQVTLAIAFRMSQSSIHRYVTRAKL